MKRWIGVVGLSIALLWAGLVWAGGSLTQTSARCYGKGEICVMTLTWIGSAADGNFTATAITAANLAQISDYFLYEVETDPGSPAPTDLYDITLTRSATGYSYDILGGRGANRSTTVTQSIFPANTTGTRYPAVGNDVWTLGITGNSQASATGKIRLWFAK